MSTKARVVLTVAAGIVMGALVWLGVDWGYAFYASVVLLPLIVGRWWVVAVLAGPFIALVALDLTGHVFPESGSDAPRFGFVFYVFFLVFSGFLMLFFVGVRKAFDVLRRRWLTATRRRRGCMSNGGDS